MVGDGQCREGIAKREFARKREKEAKRKRRGSFGRSVGRSVLRFSYANRIVELEEYGFGWWRRPGGRRSMIFGTRSGLWRNAAAQWDNQINVYFINLVVLQFLLDPGASTNPDRFVSIRTSFSLTPPSRISYIVLLFIIYHQYLPYIRISTLVYQLTRSYRVLELSSLITVRTKESTNPSSIFLLTGHSYARYANFYRSPRFIDSSVDGNGVRP